MSYKIVFTDEFEKEIKRLSKKHTSLKNDFSEFIDSLSENPQQGTSMGNECFKVRLLIRIERSKNPPA